MQTRAETFRSEVDCIFESLKEVLNKTFQESEQAEQENYQLYADVLNSYKTEIKKLTQDNLELKLEIADLKKQFKEATGVEVKVYFDHQDAERYRNQNKQLIEENKQLKEENKKLKNPPVSRYSIDIKNGGKKGK